MSKLFNESLKYDEEVGQLLMSAHHSYASIQPRSGNNAKRILDILLAIVLLIFFTPLFVLILAITAIEDGRPIYSHKRVGRYGREFPCYKFRSMRRNSDILLTQLIATDPQSAEEWRRSHKLQNDPRVTAWGRFLRSSSLDELPQLFNVLLGDMSFVGPRPVTRAEIAKYGEKAAFYLSVRPGITGAWQVSGRSTLDYQRRVDLDVNYVQNCTLANDISILFKTVVVVLTRSGAY
jgi:lipopolysaccharide/colanic/teichoic acid biosynthesis glycosyltransferase